ncbi:Dihydrolipoamide acetyltransferase component of pyruvate dehydrogenase complex [Minicystis rosea]|nr:Dihydrolipoamide acetyltransferase component of pyruvate dehydrogenase complex [Minicystis rosea]
MLVAASAAAQPAPAPRAATDTRAPSDEADALFKKGMAALSSGNTQQAYELDLAAWKLKQTHDIAGNLAQVELMLGKKRDAAEHIAFALAHFPPTVPSERREGMKKVLDGLRKDLGVLRIQVNVADAKVAIDGTPIGAAPLASEVFVEPGAHVIEATLKGYKPARASVDAARGASQDVALKLEEAPSVPPPTTRSAIPGAVIGAVGGAAAIVGIGLLVGAGSKASSASTLHDQIAAGGLGCPKDSRCVDLANTSRSADTLHNAGVGFLVGAGVAAAGTLAYFLWPRPKAEAPKASMHIVPNASATGGGVMFLGTF